MNIVNVKRGAKGAHNSLLTSAGLATVLTLSLLLSACGGGGGGGATSSSSSSTSSSSSSTSTSSTSSSSTSNGGTSSTVAVSGTVADTVSGKPNMEHGDVLRAPVNNATVQAIDATGAVAASTSTNAGGQYTLALAPNTKYVIRVSYGNVVMKAVTSVTNAAVTADVTPRTTAQVMVLAQSLGVANMGESGTSFSAAISGVDITTAITAIDSAGITTLATAVQTAVAGGENPLTTTAVTSEAQTLSATVSLVSAGVSAPSAPTGVSATAGNAQVTVSWTAVTGATSYNVYRGTSAGVTTSGLKTTGATSGGAITGLTNGTTYYFVVTAVNAGGESAVSSEANATPQVPASGAPTGVSATAGNAQVTVSWTAVTGATSYNVYRGTSAGVTTAGAKTTGATSGGSITGLSNGTAYYFVVTAVNAGGESVVSGEAAATPQVPAPGTPTGLGATAGNAQVSLTWTAVSAIQNATITYTVTRTPAFTSAVTGLTAASYTDSAVTNGTSYSYTVTAVDAGGASTASSAASATPQVPASGAPTGVSATAGNAEVTVSWTAVTGATSYNVYRGTSAGVTTAGAKTTGATSGGAITGLSNGTAYYFVVTAVNAGGESVVSGEAAATPQVPAPGTPTGLGATAGNAQVSLTWTAVSAIQNATITYTVTRTPAFTSAVTGLTAASYTDSAVTNGTSYSYTVTAVDAGGASTASSAASATPQVPASGAPTGVSATAGNAEVTVSWTAVTGATSYNVYRGTSAGVTTAGAKTTGATSGGSITGLSNGTAYYFVVTAVNAGGESVVSGEAAATPQVPAPGTPTGLGATAGNAQVSLTWTAVSAIPNATITYTVTRTPAFTSAVTGLTAASYTDSAVTNGTSYSYTVTAVDAGGASTASLAASATPQVPAPGTPTGVGATAGNAQVSLTWTAVSAIPNATITYTVTRTPAFTSAVTGLAAASYTDSAVTNGTSYSYTVTAVDAGGSSTASSAASATPQVPAPGTPTGLGATAGNAQVSLTWTAVSTIQNATISYSVYRSTSSGTQGSEIATSLSTASYTDTTAVNGTTYYYSVTAVDAGGASSASAQSSATPQIPAPSAPTGIGATGGNAQATVSWTTVSGATSYNVYRRTTAGVTTGNGTPTTGATSGGAITGLSNGTTYYFVVTAVNAGGESAVSSEVSAVTIPGAPTGVSATAGNTQVTISWTAVTGATSYNVYRGTSPGVTTSGTKTTGHTSGSAITGLTNGLTYYFVVTAVGAGGESSVSIETDAAPGWSSQAYLKAPNAQANDHFGYRVSMDADTVAVGAKGEDSNQTTITNAPTAIIDNNSALWAGAVYVFRRTGSTWAQEAYLKAPNAEAGDYFGVSVSVNGDTVAVGASDESSNQTTITNGTSASAVNGAAASGAVYVFKRTGATWAQEAYLKASNAGSIDNFGISVSVNGDTVAVGAWGESSNQTTITNGTTASADNSAGSSGAVYVFKRTGTTWAQEAYLKASNAGANDYLGYSVSVNGDTVAVGAYNESSNQTTITNAPTAIIDNNSATSSGAVYVFKRTGANWAQEAYLKAPNAEANDQFGYSVAVDGDTVAVGSALEDSSQTTITNGTGASADNSAADSGAVYVFKRTGATWAQEAYLKAPNAEGSDYFGETVSVNGDTVVVGAQMEDSNQVLITNGTGASANNGAIASGAVYVFKRTGTTWAQEAYLKAPNSGTAGDQFGVSVSVNTNSVAVGAWGESSDQTTITNALTAITGNSNAASSGAVYIFTR